MMNKKYFVAPIALAAVLGLGACSSDSGTSSNASSSSSSSTVASDARIKTPAPIATVAAIPGGTSAVALDAGFLDALTSLGVAPGVSGTATLDAATGTVTFPMTGGSVTLYDRDSGYRPWVQGAIFHDGSGLTLTAGETVVGIDDFVINPGKPARIFGDVTVNGELAASDVPLFNLDGSTLSDAAPELTGSGDAILDGTTVKLSAEAAELLNTTFQVDALAGEFVIGTAVLTVQTQ